MLIERKDLVFELVRTEFKQKYNDSILGLLWVFLMPFFQFVILFIVFKYFRGEESDPQFAAKLMIAIVTFTYFKDSVSLGATSLIRSASIISRIYFPRIHIIHSNILINFVSYILNLTIVVVIFSIAGNINVSVLSFFYLVFVILVLTLLIYCLILFLSILSVIVRDLVNILQLVLQAMFWFSGIFFDIDSIGSPFRIIIYLNPLSYIIDSIKKALVYAEVANLGLMVLLFFALILFVPFSHWFFKRNVDKVIEFI